MPSAEHPALLCPRWQNYRYRSAAGEFSFRPLQPTDDAERLHAWTSNARARFWGMQEHTVAELRAFYEAQWQSGYRWPFLGLRDGEPALLLESYDPARDVLGEHYPVARGDLGMHFLTAPPSAPRLPGYSLCVLRGIVDFLLGQTGVKRLVVEPDLNNAAIHRLNRAAGFRYQGVVQLPDKCAGLAFCCADDYRNALLNPFPLAEVC